MKTPRHRLRVTEQAIWTYLGIDALALLALLLSLCGVLGHWGPLGLVGPNESKPLIPR